jgi:hypothetical protein
LWPPGRPGRFRRPGAAPRRRDGAYQTVGRHQALQATGVAALEEDPGAQAHLDGKAVFRLGVLAALRGDVQNAEVDARDAAGRVRRGLGLVDLAGPATKVRSG